MRAIRLFSLLESVSFAVAASAHAGVLVRGYEDTEAATAEGVIAVVLLVGFGLTWALPTWTRAVGLVAMGLAERMAMVAKARRQGAGMGILGRAQAELASRETP
ncbi:MAG: hypothetical protein GEU73_02300 [Chloroflexi bacterium]|nr:hypothetical protein [Chloroflexota bacterium]